MDLDRWNRIEHLFNLTLDLPPGEQKVILERECDGDQTIKLEVERLLARDRHATGKIRNAIDEVARHAPASIPDVQSGWKDRRIGAYRLVREIGRGGMGVVFEAARDDAEFEMRVALKVAVRTAYSPEFNERFRVERQIVARLDHPNIARLIDGGETDDGIPYFAMEFVDGVPIDRYVLDHNLGLRDRIRLFLQVCDAVEYAHQHLVVHRDLKPGNILVSGGSVKLLDFGIAKVLTLDDAAGSVTATAIATPGYCSPEQWLGEPISTRTDVYSLGLILFRLLTDSSPRQCEMSNPSSLHREICVEVTPSPSRVTAGPFARQLRGDLDTIIGKATQKEPGLRYSSVAALAGDLRRMLESRPIEARADSPFYRAGRLLRRYWMPSAALALLIATLAGGIVATRIQAKRAERRFAQVRGIAKRLLGDVQNEIRDLAGSIKAQQAVVSTAVEYLDDLAKESAGDPKLQIELAHGYSKVAQMAFASRRPSLGKPEDAKKYHAKAVALIDSQPSSVFENAEAAMAAVEVLSEAGDFHETTPGEGKAFWLRAIQLGDRAAERNPNHPGMLERVADAYSAFVVSNVDSAEARKLLPRYLEAAEKAARNDPSSVSLKGSLGVAYSQAGKIAQKDGDIQLAISNFSRYVQLITETVLLEPNNGAARRNLMLALANLADAQLGPLGASSSPGPYGRRVELDETVRKQITDAFAKARVEADWRLAHDPKDSSVVLDSGILRGRSASAFAGTQAREAIVALDGAIVELHRAGPSLREVTVRFELEFRGHKAERWRQLGESGKAENEWKNAETIFRSVATTPDAKDALYGVLLRIYSAWAGNLVDSNRLPEALTVVARAQLAADDYAKMSGSDVSVAAWPARIRVLHARLQERAGNAGVAAELRTQAERIWADILQRENMPADLRKEASAARQTQ